MVFETIASSSPTLDFTCHTSPCCFAPMPFMMTQQKTHTICNPKLIAIFARLENIKRANQITRMQYSVISLGKGNSSDRGYNCEAKLSRDHL